MSNGVPPASPHLPNASDGDHLDSWKEIAAYLKRQVRTLQRWERAENLPVHRHRHDRLDSVYAYKSELDAWRHQREPRAQQQKGPYRPAHGNNAAARSEAEGRKVR